MPDTINIGNPIHTNGAWPDINKMFVGFAESKYANKEAIPAAYRFEDMHVVALETAVRREYILEGGLVDGNYKEITKADNAEFQTSKTRESIGPTALAGQSGDVDLDFTDRNHKNFYITAIDDINLTNPTAEDGNKCDIVVECNKVAGISVTFGTGWAQHTTIALADEEKVLIRCTVFDGRIFGDKVGP